MSHESSDFLEEFGELGITPIHGAEPPTNLDNPTELEVIGFQNSTPSQSAEIISEDLAEDVDNSSNFVGVIDNLTEKLQPVKRKLFKKIGHTVAVFKNVLDMNSKQKGRLIIYKDFHFLFHNRELMLIRYNGNEEIVIIPDTVGGITVASIDSEAFKNSIDLPVASTRLLSNRITNSFGKKARIDSRIIESFYNSAVKKLQLPTSLKYVPDDLFRYLNNLESVEIPARVKSIGPYAFRDSKINKIAFSCKRPKGFENIEFNPNTSLYVRHEYADDYVKALSSS